jgi:hypothetical protein
VEKLGNTRPARPMLTDQVIYDRFRYFLVWSRIGYRCNLEGLSFCRRLRLVRILELEVCGMEVPRFPPRWFTSMSSISLDVAAR